ncbi:kinase-like domain-containing protein, partial [Morchella snyderi]
MSLASVAIDDTIIERYKLQAEFSPGRSSVVHTTVIHRSSPVSGARRAVEVRTPWRDTRELGSGGFGVVSLQRTADGQCRAVKRVLRRGGVGARTELILMALSMVLDVSPRPFPCDRHTDSFVKFLGWFEDRHNLYIATEFIMYGDLSQYIKDPAMKHNARYITMQLLEGVRSLHMNNICHRDLKPQNILMASVIPVRVKIADFGCSKYHEGTELRTNVGTRCYMAPELQGLGKARRKYTNAIDMWALGCVIYEMLTSTPLFSQTKEPIFNFNLLWMFCRGDVSSHIEKLEQAQVSGKAVELIESLLRVAPEERLTAASALKSPWIIEE